MLPAREAGPRPEALPASFLAPSVLDVQWHDLSEQVGAVPHVLFDYDQATALATNSVPNDVRETICQARERGHIQSFGMASDNPFVGMLSGMRAHADYIFGPFVVGGRLVTKASPRFYQQIVDHMGVDPASIVMVGHCTRRDIANAQAVGINTIQVPPLGTLMEGVRRHRGRRIVSPLAMLLRG